MISSSLSPIIRRNLAIARLAILAQLEYRLNFFVDACLQPILLIAVEALLWWSLFSSSGRTTINGFPRDAYLAYVVWAGFFGRLSANWMYESRMCREIELGTINAIITRPISFYEYYLSQFIGYKALCTGASLVIPIAASFGAGFSIKWSYLPVALALLFGFLTFTYTISYCVSLCGFFTTRVSSFTAIKNFTLWLLCGDLFPLDLLPSPLAKIILSLPFCCGVYLPISLLTGRQPLSVVPQAILSLLIGTTLAGYIGRALWRRGIATYAGTGA
jgi:ABC-2 type transport system permease protein